MNQLTPMYTRLYYIVQLLVVYPRTTPKSFHFSELTEFILIHHSRSHKSTPDSNMADKNKILSIFAYLKKVPFVSARQLFANDSCPICMETFRDVLRSISSAINGSVRLPFCSYVLCLHCFARWVFSPNFDNACPSVSALCGPSFFPLVLIL